jgi:hypothetical protein
VILLRAREARCAHFFSHPGAAMLRVGSSSADVELRVSAERER